MACATCLQLCYLQQRCCGYLHSHRHFSCSESRAGFDRGSLEPPDQPRRGLETGRQVAGGQLSDPSFSRGKQTAMQDHSSSWGMPAGSHSANQLNLASSPMRRAANGSPTPAAGPPRCMPTLSYLTWQAAVHPAQHSVTATPTALELIQNPCMHGICMHLCCSSPMLVMSGDDLWSTCI